MQKNGAGVNTCASMVWDTTKDNFCQVRESEYLEAEATVGCIGHRGLNLRVGTLHF